MKKLWIMLLASCGPQAFLVSELQLTQKEPGFSMVPPKVDFLIAVDDTGSSARVKNELETSIRSFTTELEKKDWDFRLMVIPLTTQDTIQQVIASKYDGNWKNTLEFKERLPGTGLYDTVDPSVFKNFSTFNFASALPLNSSNNAYEPGFLNYTQTYLNNLKLFRVDALQIGIIISNGNDSSGVTFCKRDIDGLNMPCEYAGKTGSMQSSFQHYEMIFKSRNLKLNSVVAQSNGICFGEQSIFGERYIEMTKSLQGINKNFCEVNAITTLFNEVSTQLKQDRINYVTEYLALTDEPEASSIRVTVIRENGQKETLVESSEEGFSYIGKSTKHLISEPVKLNFTDGYMIQLHGSAKLKGMDQAKIEFKEKGAKDSVAK